MFDGYNTRVETTHGPTFSMVTVVGAIYPSAHQWLQWNQQQQQWQRQGLEPSVRLCQKKYRGRWAATGTGAMKQCILVAILGSPEAVICCNETLGVLSVVPCIPQYVLLSVWSVWRVDSEHDTMRISASACQLSSCVLHSTLIWLPEIHTLLFVCAVLCACSHCIVAYTAAWDHTPFNLQYLLP